MANRTPAQITRAGATLTYNAAASGDTVTPGDQVFVLVKNGGGSTITVTITAVGEVGGLTVEPLVVSVLAAAEVGIGPLPPELFGNASDGEAHIAWSATTSVTWAAVTL